MKRGTNFIEMLAEVDADVLETNSALTGLCLGLANVTEHGASEVVLSESERQCIITLLESIRTDYQKEIYSRFISNQAQNA